MHPVSSGDRPHPFKFDGEHLVHDDMTGEGAKVSHQTAAGL